MYVFLLVLGSFIAAAGLGLVASGVSFHEHTFDASNLTPGMIALIGGCILIGLALVVRALLRLERALGAPVTRALHAGDAVGAVAGAVVLTQQSEAAGIPFAPKPKPKAIPQAVPQAMPQPQPASAQTPPPTPAIAQADMMALGGMQTSAQERLESTPLVEESDISLLPKPPARAEEDRGEVHHGTNGSAHAAAASPSAPPARAAQAQAKGSIFDALWPKQQRTAADVQGVPAETVAAPPAPQVSHQAESAEPAPAAKVVASPQPERTMVSVLKSGVVEGMAYTLYSDGSIEAQLPGGTLRFGSITELRNHIEQHG